MPRVRAPYSPFCVESPEVDYVQFAESPQEGDRGGDLAVNGMSQDEVVQSLVELIRRAPEIL